MPCPIDCPPDLVNVELEPCSSEYCTCTNGIGYLVVRINAQYYNRIGDPTTKDPFSHENCRNAKRASLSTKTSTRGRVDAIGPTTIAKTVTIPNVQPK